MVGFINNDDRVEVFEPGYFNVTEIIINGDDQQIVSLEG